MTNYFENGKVAQVENQAIGRQTLRCDRRGEYFQNKFSTFCGEHGITHQNYTDNKLFNEKKKKEKIIYVDVINAIILSATHLICGKKLC